MGDYLTQLIVRSQGGVGEVRPRPISLFAPMQAVAQGSFADELLFEEQAAAEPFSPRSMRRAAPMPPPPSVMGQREADPPQPDAVEAVPQRRRSAPPRQQQSALIAEREAVERPQQGAIVAAPSPRPVAPSPLWERLASLERGAQQPSLPPVAPPVVARATEQPPRGVDGAAPVIHQQTTHLTVIEQVMAQEARQQVVEMLRPTQMPSVVVQQPAEAVQREGQQLPAAAPQVAQPMVRPLVVAQQVSELPRATAPAQQGPPAAEPTIHVTIGRIEVRATPAPAAAPKPRGSDTPAMSLEEYLRTRSGGQR